MHIKLLDVKTKISEVKQTLGVSNRRSMPQMKKFIYLKVQEMKLDKIKHREENLGKINNNKKKNAAPVSYGTTTSHLLCDLSPGRESRGQDRKNI